MWDNNIFDKAMFFAYHAHRRQEMRQPKGTPYCAHLTGVLAIAIKFLVKEEPNWDMIVQLALLHDTIEDTSITYDDIQSNFGKEVADGVLALSKDESLPKTEQMKECIERIKLEPKEVAMVKLADRIFNLKNKVADWPKEKQEFYKVEGQLICDELGYASPALKKALQDQINKY